MKRVSRTLRGARGRGGGAGCIGHLYCLKSWSDSLKPLLRSMLMPARASSASCRGAAAAAAADASPSSRRRGRRCSEPAMEARGWAKGRGEVGWQLLRPPRTPGARLYLPGAQRSRAAGRGAAGREEPAPLQRSGERGHPGHRLPPPRGITQQLPARPRRPLPFRRRARAGTEAESVSGCVTLRAGMARPPSPLPAAPACSRVHTRRP